MNYNKCTATNNIAEQLKQNEHYKCYHTHTRLHKKPSAFLVLSKTALRRVRLRVLGAYH
jgi:hypothetical protein